MTMTGFDSQNTNMLWCATSHDSACSPFDLFIFFSQFAWHILCCCQLIYRLIPVYWTVYDNPSMCMPTLDSHVTCICIFQCNLFCILWCGGRSMHNAHGMSVWLWVLLMHRKHANHLRCHAFLHVCCGCYPSDCRIYITRRHGMVGEISMNDAAVRWTCASHTFCITAGLVRLCFFDMHFVCCLLLLFYVSAIKLQKTFD